MSDRYYRQHSRQWRDSMETLVEIHPRSFGVSVDDSTWEVLPAALDRYGFGSDNWETYVLFICYDTNVQDEPQKQRCLSYDEKPLQLWIWLRNTGKNPAFLLKHVNDIKSPIAAIREKHAERLAASTGLSASESDNAGSNVRNSTETSHSDVRDGTIATNNTLAIAGASYAVAVFPYWAEAPDELDVALDDAFIVLCRTTGWWMVQRDNSGSSTRDSRSRKQGWVPSGALLETSVPVATAVAEATTARMFIATSLSTSSSEFSKPILRSCILSTSFPAVVLKDYQRQGDGELDLITDVLVRVYKRYNHWSYVVQDNGDRGWVPSWSLGKVSSDSSNVLPSANLVAVRGG